MVNSLPIEASYDPININSVINGLFTNGIIQKVDTNNNGMVNYIYKNILNVFVKNIMWIADIYMNHNKNKNLSKFLTIISNLVGVCKKIKSMVENPKNVWNWTPNYMYLSIYKNIY